jgi:arabinan endo-1,5-alpha-L-arabinosidase
VSRHAYCNPVHPGSFADPCVVRVGPGDGAPDGVRYVAVGTGRTVGGRVFEVLGSPDLVRWESLGGALDPLPDGDGTDYWAPELLAAEGRWWLYYSVGRGDGGHRLRVAVADAVTGPYRDCGTVLAADETFAIDPHPFVAPDGRRYLFFARDVLTGPRVGTMLAAAPLGDDLVSLAADPVPVLAPSADWQLFERGRRMPVYGAVYDWHTLEGPFVVHRDGRFRLFYSGGRWEDPTYGVGTAVADDPLGPWVEERDAPVLRTVPGHVLGPGHNTLVTTDDGVDVLAYHAWDPGLTARRLHLDPVRWTPAGPVVDGPTWYPTDLARVVSTG